MLRDCSDGLADALASSHAVRVRVDAWRGGQLLAQDVPIVSGTWSESADQNVNETAALSVPIVGPDGRRWLPTGRGDASPLGKDGHRLRIVYTIPRGDGTTLECPLGWQQIQDWEKGDGTVDLSCAGLLQLMDDYKLLTATSPPAGASLVTEFRRLVEGLLPVYSTSSRDRTAPSTMAWTDDRLGALIDIESALVAEMRVDPHGTLALYDDPDALPWAAEVDLIEGAGTVIDVGDGGSRDGVANVWVIRGEDAGDPARTPVFAVVRDTNEGSPTYWRTYGPVVQSFSSPLIRTFDQAQAVGVKFLGASVIQAATIPVTTIPDPRLMTGTGVRLTRADGRVHRTKILSLGLPLTHDGGAQSLQLGVVA